MSLRRITQLSGLRRLLTIKSVNLIKNEAILRRFSGVTTLKTKNSNVREFSTETTPVDTSIATYEEVKDLPNHKEKLLIDVREPQELIDTGVIPTSINIPLKTVTVNLELSTHDFLEKYQRHKPWPQTEIIFTCRSGKRAGDAREMAIKLGYKNVKNYKGSWLDWAKREGIDK